MFCGEGEEGIVEIDTEREEATKDDDSCGC
jgi:hypothetical protein